MQDTTFGTKQLSSGIIALAGLGADDNIHTSLMAQSGYAGTAVEAPLPRCTPPVSYPSSVGARESVAAKKCFCFWSVKKGSLHR